MKEIALQRKVFDFININRLLFAELLLASIAVAESLVAAGLSEVSGDVDTHPFARLLAHLVMALASSLMGFGVFKQVADVFEVKKGDNKELTIQIGQAIFQLTGAVVFPMLMYFYLAVGYGKIELVTWTGPFGMMFNLEDAGFGFSASTILVIMHYILIGWIALIGMEKGRGNAGPVNNVGSVVKGSKPAAKPASKSTLDMEAWKKLSIKLPKEISSGKYASKHKAFELISKTKNALDSATAEEKKWLESKGTPSVRILAAFLVHKGLMETKDKKALEGLLKELGNL